MAGPLRGEFGGVGQQVHHDLHQAVAIRPHPGAATLLQVQFQPLAPVLQELADADGRLFDDLRQVQFVGLPVHVAGLDLGQVQHLIDQTGEAFGLADQDAQESLALRQVQLWVVVEDLGEGADGGQGGAQLVGDRGHEVVLEAVQLPQAQIGRAQFRRRRLQLRGLALQFVAVGADLGGLVEDIHDLLEAQRLLLGDGGDQDPRRGAANGAGEQGLGEIDRGGIRRQVFRPGQPPGTGITGKIRHRPGLAQEALRQGHQFRHLGPPPPQGLVGPALGLEGTDEGAGLGQFIRLGQAPAGDQQEGTDIGGQAPHQGVGDLVEPRQAQQGLGLEEPDAEGPLFQKVQGQPAGLGE